MFWSADSIRTHYGHAPEVAIIKGDFFEVAIFLQKLFNRKNHHTFLKSETDANRTRSKIDLLARGFCKKTFWSFSKTPYQDGPDEQDFVTIRRSQLDGKHA